MAGAGSVDQQPARKDQLPSGPAGQHVAGLAAKPDDQHPASNQFHISARSSGTGQPQARTQTISAAA
jgi:hypothetical protein